MIIDSGRENVYSSAFLELIWFINGNSIKMQRRPSNRTSNVKSPLTQTPHCADCATTSLEIYEQNFYSSRSFILSFDKLGDNGLSRPFNPTLSLLMLGRDSSNIKISENTQTALFGSEDSRIADSVIFYTHQENRLILRHIASITNFLKCLVICSILLLVAAIWIEYFLPQNFTAKTLRSGAIKAFPLHYAVGLDAFLGLIAFVTLMVFSCRKDRENHIFYVVCIVGFCCIWGFVTMVYSFGANILFEYDLEEIMLVEMKGGGEESSTWTNSQNFFKCCGVSSYKSWDWNYWKTLDLKAGESTYPISCCDETLSQGTCKNRPNKANVYLTGCLDLEMDLLLGVAYFVILLVTCQFFLEIFALIAVIKIHMRQRFIRTRMELVGMDSSRGRVYSYKNKIKLNGARLGTSTKTPNTILESKVYRSSTL